MLYLGVHVVIVYVTEDLCVLGHALADSLLVDPAELVVVLLQAVPLHRQDDVWPQHQVLHALYVLSVHFHRHLTLRIHVIEILHRLLYQLTITWHNQNLLNIDLSTPQLP